MATYQQRGVESLAVASMTLERGITATFLSGRGAGFRGYIQYVRVLGTKGTVFADINRPEVYLDRGGVRTAMQVGEDGYGNLIDGVIAGGGRVELARAGSVGYRRVLDIAAVTVEAVEVRLVGARGPVRVSAVGVLAPSRLADPEARDGAR